MSGLLDIPDDKRASSYSPEQFWFGFRRFIGAWAWATLLLGVGSACLAVLYVGSTTQFEFDSELERLRSNGLVWALRVGSASCSTISTTQIGINAENPEFEREQRRVRYGSLDRAYQGTYLAYFQGEHWPTVLTCVLTVGENGQVSATARQNGWKLIGHYLLFFMLVGFSGVIAVEFFNRKKMPFSFPKTTTKS